jgi:hypothetical protein
VRSAGARDESSLSRCGLGHRGARRSNELTLGARLQGKGFPDLSTRHFAAFLAERFPLCVVSKASRAPTALSADEASLQTAAHRSMAFSMATRTASRSCPATDSAVGNRCDHPAPSIV